MVRIHFMEMKCTKYLSVEIRKSIVRKRGYDLSMWKIKDGEQPSAIHQVLDIFSSYQHFCVRYYYSYFIFEEPETRGSPRM